MNADPSMNTGLGITDFLKLMQVSPYGVLGTMLTKDKRELVQAPEPDATVAIVDPAGLTFIQSDGPRGAGGAAGAIYKWLGLAEQPHFPAEVKGGVQRTMDAKLHEYAGNDFKQAVVIHAVGPDF